MTPRERVAELARTNPMVRRAFDIQYAAEGTYEEMLEVLVVALVEANEKLTADLIEEVMRKPYRSYPDAKS